MDLDQRIQLGKRALKSKGFHWMDGMIGIRDAPGYRDHGKSEIRIVGTRDVDTAITFGSIPDVEDPATLGCLVQLAKKIVRIPNAWCIYQDNSTKWHVFWSGATHGGELGCGNSEAEAWINTIENHWKWEQDALAQR